MLEMTDGGRCMSGVEAVEFFERLADSIDEELKTEEFCEEYTRALNRVRYEVRKSVPMKPKKHKGTFTYHTCGQCGSGVRGDVHKHCPECGREIQWPGGLM